MNLLGDARRPTRIAVGSIPAGLAVWVLGLLLHSIVPGLLVGGVLLRYGLPVLGGAAIVVAFAGMVAARSPREAWLACTALPFWICVLLLWYQGV
jgi:hypothetical protein